VEFVVEVLLFLAGDKPRAFAGCGGGSRDGGGGGFDNGCLLMESGAGAMGEVMLSSDAWGES
jgi:hypothetical protein